MNIPKNAKGFYQPYSDTPTDEEPFALNVHLNMIQHAKEYIYIDAPYLILTESMKTALKMAAKNGVDVRILTPHIPDKKLVFQITRGHYFDLISNGVKIYEYTPGFNHAKNMVLMINSVSWVQRIQTIVVTSYTLKMVW